VIINAQQVEKESANVKRMSGGQSKGAIAAVDFPVNAKFTFDKEHAAYLLSIELQCAIDIVILRSPVVLDLVDSGNHFDCRLSVRMYSINF
jgi:hypothetical protein